MLDQLDFLGRMGLVARMVTKAAKARKDFLVIMDR